MLLAVECDRVYAEGTPHSMFDFNITINSSILQSLKSPDLTTKFSPRCGPCSPLQLFTGTIIDKEPRAIAKAAVAAAVASNNNVIRAHAKVALLLGFDFYSIFHFPFLVFFFSWFLACIPFTMISPSDIQPSASHRSHTYLYMMPLFIRISLQVTPAGRTQQSPARAESRAKCI